MTIDRKDWIEIAKFKQQSNVGQRVQAAGLERLRQAAVPAERLMAEEHWRIYQQMLQAAVEQQTMNRDRLLAQLMSDRCNSYEDMTRVKRMIAECEAMILAWTTAIDLPKQLIESAERAAEALAKTTEAYDEKEPAYGVR
jgi:hypothetical protein